MKKPKKPKNKPSRTPKGAQYIARENPRKTPAAAPEETDFDRRLTQRYEEIKRL